MPPTDTLQSEPVHLIEDAATGDRLLIYATERGIKVELRYESDTLWMTQAQMAEMFGVDRTVIGRHLRNIFDEGELEEAAVCAKYARTADDGKTYQTQHYNLDAVISVGYRVNSRQGTLFRKWATEKLVQFATKGFVIEVERLKDPENFDHFSELREIIRDIRASEANLYKEVQRICSLCSDYRSLSDREKNTFFAAIQNKLHYAVAGMTGAEIRVKRANASLPYMGLTTWKGDEPTQQDAMTAKNFLGDAEIRDLNRFTGMLLDYFEQETELQRLVTMMDAQAKLDKFILNNERPLLRTLGSVSKVHADAHAKAEYKKFNEKRRRTRHEQAERALAELREHEKALPKPKRQPRKPVKG